MWRRVILVRTEVSEERIASIFSVERINELGTTLAVTSNWSTEPVSGSSQSFSCQLLLTLFPAGWCFSPVNYNIKKQTPWLLVRKRTISTDRLPRPAKYCRLLRVEGVAWSSQRIPKVVNLCFLDAVATFHSNNISIILIRLSGLRTRSTTWQKIW
jgi:hypothetical protein